MRNARVAIFMALDFTISTGSTVWARCFLGSMAQVSRADVLVIFAGPTTIREANEKVARTMDLESRFIPFHEAQIPTGPAERPKWRERARNILLEKYYFWGEQRWRQQQHVDTEFRTIVEERRPDLIMIAGMGSAFYVQSAFSLRRTCCLITLDNDLRVFPELKRRSGRSWMSDHELQIYRRLNWIANIRVRKYVARIHRQCDGILALTHGDLPANLPDRVVRAVIPPVLPTSDRRWSYRGSRCVLFVGNIIHGTAIHFPNRMAIEWICKRLAPELRRVDATIRINIIGASNQQVPRDWHCANVNLLGRGTEEDLITQLTTADLFIAPIENNYGAKLKLAECASYGTPFMATDGAMSGLPFLTFMPRFDLTKPAAAASLLKEHIDSAHKLINLSRAMALNLAYAHGEQRDAWGSVVRRLLGLAPGYLSDLDHRIDTVAESQRVRAAI